MLKFIKHIGMIILLLGFISLSAQEFGSNVINTPIEEKPVVVKKQGFNPDIDVSVSLGTSFSSFGPGMNMFGTYVMPEFTIPVSKKFAVRAGIGYSTIFYSSPANEGNIFSQNNAQYGHIYVTGIYHVNEKLTISGTAYKTFDLATRPEDQFNPHAFDFSNQGVNVNIDYKVSDRVRFNVGVSYQKQSPYNNMYNRGGFNNFGSPFNQGGFGSPFGPGF
jgi:hypothetical protein